MDQTKSCDCGKCSSCSSKGSCGMDCCNEHKMSKEHLEMKKQMLEEKLKWVNGELGKTGE